MSRMVKRQKHEADTNLHLVPRIEWSYTSTCLHGVYKNFTIIRYFTDSNFSVHEAIGDIRHFCTAIPPNGSLPKHVADLSDPVIPTSPRKTPAQEKYGVRLGGNLTVPKGKQIYATGLTEA
jgi:hypothetical protein